MPDFCVIAAAMSAHLFGEMLAEQVHNQHRTSLKLRAKSQNVGSVL